MLKIVLNVALAAWVTVPSAYAWEMSELVIYLWRAPKVADLDAKAKALADAGFTVVNWEPEHLDVLQKYGLKAMVHDPTPEMASRLADHPAVWGYHCGDEPYPEEEFPPIAARFEALRQADPYHPAFVNMLSTTGEFLRKYMDVVKPEILSFDYYQWWWGSDRYFGKLEQFREAAMLAGVPLGSCIEVTANPGVEWGDNRSQSVVVRLQSKWLGIAPWHKPKTYRYAVAKLDKQTGKWITISASSFVGFTFVIGPAEGELFRIKTEITP